MLGAKQLSAIFTNDQILIDQTTPALMAVFLATPLLVIQLIGSAYYQAIGKALPALFLSLLKQGIFLIPLILILPRYFGLNGVWFAFPIADVCTAVINFFFLRKAYGELNESSLQENIVTTSNTSTFADEDLLDSGFEK